MSGVRYNPRKHHRRSIRLKGYDYSKTGKYFVTICCHDRILRFGQINNRMMDLNEFGQIAFDEWTKLPDRFNNMELDVFQIMPNHMHGIISLTKFIPNVGATLAVDQNNDSVTPEDKPDVPDTKSDEGAETRASPAPTIGDIVGAYKSLVANECLKIYKSNNKMMGKLWQRNYYESIIRNEKAYHRIANYIRNNPANWKNDKFYKK